MFEEVVLAVETVLFLLAIAGTVLAWWLLRPDRVLQLELTQRELSHDLTDLKDRVVPAAKLAAETIYERAEDMFDAAETKRRRNAARDSKVKQREEAEPEGGVNLEDESIPRADRLALVRAAIKDRA